MKRTIILGLIAIQLLLCSTAYALLFNAYGAPILEVGFEYQQDFTAFPYLLLKNGTVSEEPLASYTMEESHGGKTSVKLDLSVLQDGDTVSFGRSLTLTGADPSSQWYYLSFYLKGGEIREEDFSLLYSYPYTFQRGTYSARGLEPADSSGWYRAWFLLPPRQDFSTNNYNGVGLQYTKKSGSPDAVYIDDYSITTVPTAVAFENRSIPGSGSFQLSSITGYSYSPDGVRERIENIDLVTWRVLQGNAQVQGETLLFEAGEGQTFLLEGDFFTRKATVTLTTAAVPSDADSTHINLVHGPIAQEDGVFRVNVTNNGAEPETASLLVAVYNEKEYLDSVRVYTETIAPRQTITITSAPVSTPPYISRPVVRVYLWTSLFQGYPTAQQTLTINDFLGI